MLQNIFTNLIQQYTSDEKYCEKLWQEIATNYTKSNRYYHTLSHLEDLLQQVSQVRDEIQDWNTILFTLFYHDVIYKSTKSNNEEKSAELAAARMAELNINVKSLDKCKSQIIATKSHSISKDSDTNYFTDADLSILGRDWETYQAYCANIRQEYAIYPNFLYQRGRKKVIDHFLTMEKIFKTEVFSAKYEDQARENLIRESARL